MDAYHTRRFIRARFKQMRLNSKYILYEYIIYAPLRRWRVFLVGMVRMKLNNVN